MTMPIALRTRVPSALLLLSLSAAAQQKPAPLSPFVKQDAPLLILEHVRLIDGTGAAPREDMRIDIGFTPLEAIRIASLNGARFMGKDAVIGSIAVGKAADIVVLGANPAEKIDNMEKVELVFKDGVGYDPDALIQSVGGLVGLR
jgi:hypothetical protein